MNARIANTVPTAKTRSDIPVGVTQSKTASGGIGYLKNDIPLGVVRVRDSSVLVGVISGATPMGLLLLFSQGGNTTISQTVVGERPYARIT